MGVSLTQLESRAPRTPAAAPEAASDIAAPWRRLLAFCIDAALLTLLTGALWGRLLASFANRLSSNQAVSRVLGQVTADYLIVLCCTICLVVLYYWLLTGYWGTTIGKRALGIWVVRADNRTKPDLRAAFARAAVFVIGGELLLLFFAADNLWLLGNRERKCLHDRAARTLVIRRSASVSRRASSGRLR